MISYQSTNQGPLHLASRSMFSQGLGVKGSIVHEPPVLPSSVKMAVKETRAGDMTPRVKCLLGNPEEVSWWKLG